MHVFLEFSGRLCVHKAMRVPVRRDFVAIADALHQIREFRGDQAQNKKRGTDFSRVEYRQQALSVGAHPALQRVPTAARNRSLEHADVKIVFHVHGHPI